MTELCREIDRLAGLPAGWDSIGADPPDPGAAAAAQAMLHDIVESAAGLSCPTAVTASRSGGIQFEWGSHDTVYFELECTSADHVEYYFCDTLNGVEKEGEFAYSCGTLPGEIATYVLHAIQEN